MKAASSQGHDIKLIHWMHPDEKFLPYQGEVEFIDLEHKTEDLKLFPEDLQQAYLETYQKHCEQIQQSLKQLKNVHYHLIDITQSIESWLIDTLRTTA
jgi:hypothetical protein